jgi:hypothetical protein
MAMTAQNRAEPYQIGAYVTIRHSGLGRVQIIEDRGLLGPGGTRIYRLLIRKKPKPGYIEVREDQLELAPEEK